MNITIINSYRTEKWLYFFFCALVFLMCSPSCREAEDADTQKEREKAVQTAKQEESAVVLRGGGDPNVDSLGAQLVCYTILPEFRVEEQTLGEALETLEKLANDSINKSVIRDLHLKMSPKDWENSHLPKQTWETFRITCYVRRTSIKNALDIISDQVTGIPYRVVDGEEGTEVIFGFENACIDEIEF